MDMNHNEIFVLNEKNTGKKIDKFLTQWFGLPNKNSCLNFFIFFKLFIFLI